MGKNGTSNLVIGLGEVGSAIRSILQCDGIDAGDMSIKKYDFVHICFPYSETFKDAVSAYKKKYLADGGTLVIHSTVAVGTSDELGAVHHPIRGVHPNLEKGIRTFVNYFGGRGAAKAASEFIRRGIECRIVSNAKNTEAGKLISTSQYGMHILIEKAIYQYCEENGLDFDIVYTDFNKTYNGGYTELGMSNVVRPVLKHVPGKIGGHCVVPNAKILGGWIGETIVEENGKL